MNSDNKIMAINLILAQEHKAAQKVAEMVPTSKIPEVHRAIRVYLADRRFADGFQDSADRGMGLHNAREKLLASLEELEEEA